jgi:hypothetical protein
LKGYRTPHDGPTRHMFLEVDRVEEPRNRNLESVSTKNVMFFSLSAFLPTIVYPGR